MTKVKFNPFLEKLSGSYGDIVFRHVGDRIIIAHKPDLDGVVPSAVQLTQRERFRQAVLYAKGALSLPLTRQPYQLAAERSGKPVFALAVADYLHAPVVAAVDLAGYTGKIGDKLIVTARDDFGITALQVRLLDGTAAEIEKGPATEEPLGSGHWVYVAKTAVTPGSTVQVAVNATDRPGNQAALQSQKIV